MLLPIAYRNANTEVDDNVAHWLIGFRITARKQPDGQLRAYVGRRQLSRLIASPKANQLVDHIDRNPLNNRKSNLRVCSPQDNCCNRKPSGTSRFLGVYYETKRKVWRASITRDGKTIKLGRFQTEEEAARAYDKAAHELHGEYANLNFALSSDIPRIRYTIKRCVHCKTPERRVDGRGWRCRVCRNWAIPW